MNATPLFEPPEPYTATVKLSDIREPDAHGARSHTRRSLEAFGALTLPLLRELYEPGHAPEGGPYFEVVDGARRILDLLDANPRGKVEVKVLPWYVDPGTAAAMSVALNFGRAPNPLQEAEHLSNLREKGYDLDQIAEIIGAHRSKVKRRLALVDSLHERLRDATRKGDIAITVAERIAKLSPDLQLRFVDKLEMGEADRITGEDVTEVLQDVRSDMLPQGELFEQEDWRREALRKQLQELRKEGLDFEDAMATLQEAYDAG